MLPSHYVNRFQVTHFGGLSRIDFLECAVTKDGGNTVLGQLAVSMSSEDLWELGCIIVGLEQQIKDNAKKAANG